MDNKTHINKKFNASVWKPIALEPKRGFRSQLKKYGFKEEFPVIVDNVRGELEEMFLLRNPKFRFNLDYQQPLEAFVKRTVGNKPVKEFGNWFYFPWLSTVVHFLPERMHQELRTGRNRFLITEAEQTKYHRAHVVIFGMSVGSHAALTIAMTGGPRTITLADPDTISGSNLNRIRTGFHNVGISKAVAVARQIMEINPYSRLTVYEKGATEKNLRKIFAKRGKPSLVVEEMDNAYFKFMVRQYARKARIPVIMAGDNGDNIIVDIERFDTHPHLPLLHGIMGNKLDIEHLKHLSPDEIPKTIAKIAGADRATIRMHQSVLSVGKTLYSWPQLGTAATLCGATLAYLARRIICGDPLMKNGRYEVNLDSIFESDYNTKSKLTTRRRETKKFMKALGLV